MSEAVQRVPLWRRWVVNPIVNQLTQGANPQRLAMAVAYGVVLGIFPLLGTTTLLSLAVGIPLKLNQPVLQIFRELSYPLHLATILVFIHAGETLYGAEHLPLSLSLLTEKFFASPSDFMKQFGMLGVYAISAWAVVAPILWATIFFIARPLISHLSQRKPAIVP
ncbi:MAG: DUF2062 domain-containing protein [Verrucomicrobiales bacterium]|nr:DUF2062 domain-containing protein [Verrucomicrobiales bacterium]MCP5557529.1 DUF2062 domain-containing protein [Verrucomicrobiaceae bacterium]